MDTENAAGGRPILAVELRIRGQIDKDWSSRFGGLTIAHTGDGDTVLSGHLRDQPELRGLLSWLADLGLELISATARPVGSARE